MAIRNINQLRCLCAECEVLRHILFRYTGSERVGDILNDIKCNDTLWVMAEQNDMKESEVSEWIDAHMETPVECSVFKEHGPAGGWPVVQVKCLDKVFYFDWVLE